MKFEKLLYSKCPCCKEHGIRLFKPFGIKFGNDFKISVITKIFAISTYILSLRFMYLVFRYLSDVSVVKITVRILFILLVLFVEYFLPVKHVDDV